MPLPSAVQRTLVDRFTPLLYMSLDEPHFPVSPRDYVAHCAMWSSHPPAHEKNDWGVADGMNRGPVVARGELSFGSLNNLHVRTKHLWLDLHGWHDNPSVTPSSLNTRAGLSTPNLQQPSFAAEVWTLDDLAHDVGPAGLLTRFGFHSSDPPELLQRVIVIAYHFLFPLHRQPRRDTAHDPVDDPYTGDYEGDWCSFAVVARADGSPLDETAALACVPVSACFGQRWRPTAPDHSGHMLEHMLLRPWSSLLKVDEHPVVVAAPGTHNLYPHDTPPNDDGTVKPLWVGAGQSASEGTNRWVGDMVEQPYAAVLALKVLAGFALGGPIGLVIGAAGAAAEAAEAEEEGLLEVEPINNDPPLERDDPLADDWVDLEKEKIGAHSAVTNLPLADPAQSDIRAWQCTPEEALELGLWLQQRDPATGSRVFTGAWGVRCDEDPLAIRSGMLFPAYRTQVVDALLKQGDSP